MDHDALMATLPPDATLCLDLCDAIDGETMCGEPAYRHTILPDGRLMARSIVGAVPGRLSEKALSLVKLMQTARRHLDDLGYNMVNAEMCVHFTGKRNGIPVAIMKVICGPKEQDNG